MQTLSQLLKTGQAAEAERMLAAAVEAIRRLTERAEVDCSSAHCDDPAEAAPAAQ